MLKLLRVIKAYKSRTLSEFINKFEKRDYYSVLQINNPNTVTDEELKTRYYTLLKKYHSDHSQNLSTDEQKQYNQITKYIIKAYDEIQQQRFKQQKFSGNQNGNEKYDQQDQVSMKIFGRRFAEIKMDLYKHQNWAQRKMFNEQLLRVRQQKEQRQYEEKNKNSNFYYYKEKINKSQMENMPMLRWFLGFSAFLIGGYIIYDNFRTSDDIPPQKLFPEPKKYTKEQFEVIQKNSTQLFRARVDKVIKSIVDEHPPMLSYPSGEDPDVSIQLTEYSIAPDIHLFQVNPKYFFDRQNTKKIKFQQLDKLQLTKIKQNLVLTLSLEAERCLQNVYVKVKDVIQELEKTGNYVPPKIFFRFFGYILFQIRQKPLSLKNYRNNDWISLFDLYFDYYSPIFFKRNQYSQYLVGSYHELDKFGYVHLNHRQIPQVMLQKGEKYVFMRKPTKECEQFKYLAIWNKYYSNYKKHLAITMLKGNRDYTQLRQN